MRKRKERALVRSATPNQEIYFPGGGRGLFDVALQTVAITDASDILKVDVKPEKITLKPGQEVRLDVTIERHKDYTKSASLDVMLRHLNRVYCDPLPPGVTMVAGKSKTLLGTGNTGHIVLKADAKAEPRAQPYPAQLLYLLDVYKPPGGCDIIFHERKQIGAPRQNLGLTLCAAKQSDGLLFSSRACILKCVHCFLPSFREPLSRGRA